MVLLALLLVPGNTNAAPSWQAHVSGRLLALLQEQGIAPIPHAANPPQISSRQVRVDSMGRTQIEVFHPCGQPVDQSKLAEAGFKVSLDLKTPPYCVIQGWVNTSNIPAIASIPGISIVDLPNYATVHGSLLPKSGSSPSIPTSTANPDSEGVSIMNAGTYTAQTGINGSGVNVGVISGGDISLQAVINAGYLPNTVKNLGVNTNVDTYNDEGTMMLEEVHAVAPGANLYFCGGMTPVDYSDCLNQFAQAGVSIIADDVNFYDMDKMSVQSSGVAILQNVDGTWGESVQNFLTSHPHITLFSAAGNNQRGFWQGFYNPTQIIGSNGTPMIFTQCGQVDSYFESFVPGATLPAAAVSLGTDSQGIWLQWGEPFGQNTAKIDLYIITSDNVLVAKSCGGTQSNGIGYGTAPVDFIPPTQGNYALFIGTSDQSLAGIFLKLDLMANDVSYLGSTISNPGDIATSGGIDSPQKMLPDVYDVGAVNGQFGGNLIEYYSQQGPITLLYPSYQTVYQPSFAAPDNVTVYNAGTFFPDNPFSGTSAATPNAAGVLALLEASFPGVPVNTLLQYMAQGAVQLGGNQGTYNGIFGYGRVDATGALNVAAVTPATGWWWDPNDPGMGFTIEKNAMSGRLFMAAYLYDTSGRAAWYAAGAAPMSGSTFTAPLMEYSGGQTLTGAYQAPTANTLGNLSVTFSDASHGTLTWPGGTIPIQRFDIVAGGSSSVQPSGTPQAGWWWDPAQGGRGFSIEIQNGTLFMAGYMYDASGNPIWYASGPTPMINSNYYQGTWQQYGNGITLTGAYKSPTVTNSDVGVITLIFTSTTTATLILPDGSAIPLIRYSF